MKGKKRAKPRKREEKIIIHNKDAALYNYFNDDRSEKEAGEHRHPREVRKVDSITHEKDGSITIRISASEDKRRKALIDKLADKIGGKVDARDIMKDVLGEAKTDILEEIDKRLKAGRKVKPREGCFHVDVGNIRIPIRD